MCVWPELVLFNLFVASVLANFETSNYVDMHVDVEKKLYWHVDFENLDVMS